MRNLAWPWVLPFLCWDGAFLSGSTRTLPLVPAHHLHLGLKLCLQGPFLSLTSSLSFFSHSLEHPYALYCFCNTTVNIHHLIFYIWWHTYCVPKSSRMPVSERRCFVCVCVSLMITCGIITGILEKAMATTPVFWPGESHGQRNLEGYLLSMGSQRVGHDWATNAFTLA